MEKIAIDGLTFDGIAIPTAHTKILLIRGEKAHLGCGYFSLAPADPYAPVQAMQTAFDPGILCFSDEYYDVLGIERAERS